MKLKKALLSISMIITMVAITVMPNIVFAADKLFLGISETDVDTGWGYSIKKPGDEGAHIIWNILEYMTEEGTTLKKDGNKNIYCVNAGIGFSDTQRRYTYDTSYNMKTQADQIKAQNNVLKALVDGKVPGNDAGTTISRYNALLALGDMLYLKGDSEEQKMALLEAAGTRYAEDEGLYYYVDDATKVWDTLLTDDDIKAVQQAAMWYFTNYYEPDTTSGTYTETTTHDTKYDKTSDNSWLNYTLDGATYDSLSGYNQATREGLNRQEQAEILYNYLIKTAKTNASNYSSSNTTTEVPAKVNTESLNYEESGSNYIVGPINITKNSTSTTLESIDLVVKNNGTETENYKILDNSKNEVTSKDINDVIGQDFYISVPKESTTSISVSIPITYSSTTLTLWTAQTGGDSTQPVMIPEKTSTTVPWEKTVTPDSKPFDLALRKYITKVNGKEVTDSRVPTIDTTTLTNGGTTANYNHRKDPVTVETGNKVTYKLTVYNEGEKDGRATKIVDQLPTGLKFSKVVSGNFDADTTSYDQNGDNKLTLMRKASNTENLSAYKQGDPDSETIEIECEVVATPDQTETKILTNVAWISEEIDSDGTVITNQEGADRDSEPATIPTATNGQIVNKDNMENYKGNDSNKETLTDENYHYKGKQDDDDFEKLMLLPQSFDLKLIKRITAVNDQNVPERIEKVDVSKLNTIDENGELITTAKYILSKDPVAVKKGDIVTYTFRIYNEGTIDGYASEITEDIPEGLEYLWDDGIDYNTDGSINWNNVTKEFTDAEKAAIEFNFANGWSYGDDSTYNTIKTDHLSRDNETIPGDGSNLIKAFDSTKGYLDTETEKNPDYKEVSVKLKVVSEDLAGTIIRNEACISEDTDENGDPADDRDSSTEDWKKEDSDEYYDEDEEWPIYKEDDEDYDNIVLKSFDLSLRKFIVAVSDDTDIKESEYLKDSNGSYTRAPEVDTSKLNTKDENGNVITTAIYNHTKEPVEVKRNDIVIYNLRVYNEGEIDGYAAEIRDHLPSYLEFVEGDFNEQYGWEVSEDGRTVTTKYLENEKISKPTTNANGKTELDSADVQIMCKVKDTAKKDEKITNIADITIYLDENKESVKDRDSEENNVELPNDSELPTYKDNETGNYIPGQEDDDDFEKLKIKDFDLALRKFIIAVSDDTDIENSEYLKDSNGSYTRAPKVDTSKLNTKDENGNVITTAIYNHTKEPVEVKRNDIVIYNLRVYNEGEIDGYAAEIKDHLPSYLEFVEGDFNEQYGWEVSEDGRTVTTKYLENTKLNKAVKEENPTTPEKTYKLAYADVPIMCKVKDTAKKDEKITNIADITIYLDENKKSIDDRDSEEGNVDLPNDSQLPTYKDDETGDYIPGQEDDDDFEKLKIKEFDLALRKFIIAVSDDTAIEKNEYLKDSNGSYTRAPEVDTSKLNTKDENGNVITTAIYNHTKEPVEVKRNDIVIYNLRVYNEGEIDGYAAEIKDHLPSYLEFVEGGFNEQYGWEVSEDGRTVTTKYLENAKISKPTTDENGKITLDYKDVPIMCKVKDTAKTNEKITNIADITIYLDENKNAIIDRDSEENNVKLPEDDELPTYKDDETADYIPGQEDDDDFEKIIIKKFDLALRKFITDIDEKEVTTRIPQVKYENEEITYEHDKTPMLVVTGNVVTYTIRVFNEGEVAGYAKEITDDIPAGLEFLPDNELNKTMRWKMIDEEGNETEDVSKAVKITTDYLSKEQEENDGENLLNAFDPNKEISETNPDYKDVKVAFKVIEPNSSDNIIINSAQISDDSDENGKDIDDEDSIPDEWNEGEDDQDREYIKLVEFDLALRKWVTQAIVIDSKGQTVTETGHQPYDDPEQVVKVELHRKKLNEVTVKFRYSIRVINEGDIAGYAKEVTDYVPQGLKFVAEDNPGWTDEGNNVISTRLLEDTLLQPGEYADVEVVLTWVNSQDNMGVMTNIAEISEDYNDYGVPDRDSTPDNQKEGEDDIDDAPVMLSISTGQMRVYFVLGFAVLVTIAGGVLLIRKYVL